VTGSGATRQFTITDIQSNITALGVNSLEIQTFSVNYSRGSPPANHNSGDVSAQIASGTKVWNVPFDIPATRYTVANGNWEQVGWTTGATMVLNHRNFANAGTPSTTLFVPDGITTWGAGTGVVHHDGTPVTWTTLQRRIPAGGDNPSIYNATISLNPIWAPQQTAVSFVQGAAPPGSGDRGGDTVVIQRLTGNQFTYPGASFTINSGAIWEQIGWSRNPDINARIHRPLSPPTGDILHNHVITAGSTVSFEAWGTTRTYYPVWRRAFTQGSVNIQFIGAPHGFTETSLKTIADDPNISSSMSFVVNGTQIFHTEDTTAQVLLPSATQMNTLGQAHGLTFGGWYIRTSWAPATQQITATNAEGKFIIPWQNGIFPTPWAPNEWEPYVWIEAWWT